MVFVYPIMDAVFIKAINPASSAKNPPITPRVTPKVFQGIVDKIFTEAANANKSPVKACNVSTVLSGLTCFATLSMTSGFLLMVRLRIFKNPNISSKNPPMTPMVTPKVAQLIDDRIAIDTAKENNIDDIDSISFHTTSLELKSLYFFAIALNAHINNPNSTKNPPIIPRVTPKVFQGIVDKILTDTANDNSNAARDESSLINFLDVLISSTSFEISLSFSKKCEQTYKNPTRPINITVRF